ncbi:MAG: GatB/YqeY domain-containing protein [Chloroflexota bacterium]
MSTRENLENALKDAMRANDDLRKRTLRMAIAAIKFAQVEKGQPPDEAGVIAIVQKEIKSRQESIADAQKANRPDLVEASQAEIEVLKSFLPQPLTPEELDALARAAIAEVGATGPREMGQVMKLLTARLQGRATGDQASQAVRKLLQ